MFCPDKENESDGGRKQQDGPGKKRSPGSLRYPLGRLPSSSGNSEIPASVRQKPTGTSAAAGPRGGAPKGQSQSQSQSQSQGQGQRGGGGGGGSGSSTRVLPKSFRGPHSAGGAAANSGRTSLAPLMPLSRPRGPLSVASSSPLLLSSSAPRLLHLQQRPQQQHQHHYNYLKQQGHQVQQRQQPSLLKEQNSHTALRSQPSTPSRAPRASSKGRFYQLIRAQERDSRGKSIDTDSDSDREQMVSPSSRTAKDTSMSRPRTRSSSSSSVSSAAVATATATAAAAAMARPSPGLLVRATLSTSTRQERKDSGGGGPSVISGPFDVRLPAADKIGPLRPLNGAVLPDAAPTTTEMTAQAVAAKLIATPRRTTAAERERERPYPPSSSQRFHGLSLSRHPSMEPSERAHQHHPYSYANSGSIDASSDRPLSPRLPGPPSEESEGEQPARVSKASKASSFFSLMSTSSLVSEAHEDRNAAAAAAVVSSGGGSGGGSGGAYSGGGGGGGGSGSGSSNTRTTRHPSSSSGLSFKDKLKSAVRSVRRPHSKRSLSSLSASSTIDAQHYASLGSSSSPACKTGGEPSPLSLSPSSPRRAIDIGSRHPSPLYHHGEGDFEGHQQRPSNASERMTPMGQPPQLRRPKTAPSLKLHSSQDTATHVPVETGPKPRRASKSQHPSPLLHSHRAADEGQPAGDGASLVRITASELARMRERPDGRLNAPSSSKKLDTAKSQAGVNATAVRPRPAQARQHALRTTATTPPTFSILQDLPVAEVLQQDVTSSPLRPHTSDAPTPPRFHTTPTSDQRRPKTSGEPASHALLQVDAPLRPASIRARRDSLDADEAVPWREGTGEIAQPCSPPQQRSLPLPGSLPHHPCPPSSPASCPQSVGQSSPEARIQAKHSPHLQHLQVQQQTSNSSSTTTTVNPLLQVLLADDAMSPRASTEDTANDFLETVLFEKPATLSPPGSADDDGQAQGVDHVLDLSHIEDGRNDCCFTRHSILRSRFSVSDSPASEEEDEDEEEEDEEEEEEDDDDEGGEEKNEDDDKMENGNKDDAEAMRSSTDSEARAYKATATSTVTPADDGDGNRFEVTGVTIRQRGPGEAPAIVLDMKVTVNMGVGRPPRVFTGSTELERRDVVTIMSSMALVPRPALSAAPRSLPGDDAGSQDATPTSRVMTRDSSTSISSAGGSGGLRPLLLGSRSSLSFRSPALGFDTISRRGSVSAPPSKTTGMLQAQTQAQAQTQTQAQNSGQEGTVSAINSPRRSMSSPFLMTYKVSTDATTLRQYQTQPAAQRPPAPPPTPTPPPPPTPPPILVPTATYPCSSLSSGSPSSSSHSSSCSSTSSSSLPPTRLPFPQTPTSASLPELEEEEEEGEAPK